MTITNNELRNRLWGPEGNPIFVIDNEGIKHPITAVFEVTNSTDEYQKDGIYLRIDEGEED